MLLDQIIARLQQKMMMVGPLRPGSLSRQARGGKKPYGSYWHLSYTHRGKGHTEYIREEAVKQVREEIANYQRFRSLCDRLLTASIRRSQLLVQGSKIPSPEVRTLKKGLVE